MSDPKKPVFRGPLKPRPGLFYLGMGLFVGWLGVLVYLFLATVYPHPELDLHRRAHYSTRPADSAAESTASPADNRPGAPGAPIAPR